MPKRMLDSSYLNSPSLDRCSFRAQDSFPRFILLADDFGCFEVDARRLAVLGWSAKRNDVTPELVTGWLEEYVWAGMAVLWTENERRYCYLTGWEGPHGQRKRHEYEGESVQGRKGSKRRTPAPPADLVAAVAAGVRRDHDGRPPGLPREDEIEKANDSLPAREIQFPAAVPVDSRGFPAPAVAVAVAAAAGKTAAAAHPSLVDAEPDRPRLTVVDEAGDRPAPAPTVVEVFRRRLSESLARTAPHPVGGGKTVLDSVAAALAIVPTDEAVEFCRQRVLADVQAGRQQPRTLSAFASMLAEEVTRRKATQGKRPTRYVGVDEFGQPIPEVRQ